MKGSLDIVRYRTDDGDKVEIRIVDDGTHIIATSMTLSLTDFARALMGLGGMKGELTINKSPLIGMVRESKHEEVVFQTDHFYEVSRNKEIADAGLAPYEVDGWKAYRDDLKNGHHHVQRFKGKGRNAVRADEDGTTTIKVLFFRFIDPVTGVPAQLEDGND